MNTNLIRIGDTVTVTIEKESREWGYDPCPDGTVATVIGFGEMHWGRIHNCGLKPGIHTNKCWVKLQMPDGREHTENSSRLELQDKEEATRRLAEYRSNWEERDRNEDWLRDLPETLFWEGDVVRFRDPSKDVRFSSGVPDGRIILRINYDYLIHTCDNGSPYPFYDVSDSISGGWSCAAKERDLELVERGNVWKYFHGETLTFKDLREEAEFFVALGHTIETRNPANGFYMWTKDEVLASIKEGTVHAFTAGGPFNTVSIYAYRFRDEELGKRVAAETLKGFAEDVL